jgi:hypothetical protein
MLSVPTFAKGSKNQARERYVLEPWIHPFAGFLTGASKDVLEIGVGDGGRSSRMGQSPPAFAHGH